ncbi:cobalamin synthase [Trabulsiella guamensis ATCC 49490]|uniref:Adenosylcobinamide-GDP ribazoletransferase n=1 Tax=Trabulsiella guamensis ATCC 49490 TaxID=1005994 RepID=A0A084ZLG5_9ENTR|nr:adenosylcobinamide-GDP ribazoletransferase [Trabulsiella guamensis]KFB98309.1 cobalamin synthase [Trabulsiella guamensis ATCC 49490]
MNRVFFATLSFMSRLPVPQRWSQGVELQDYVRGIITFPLVGLLLGALSGVVFSLLHTWCGTPLAALFAVLTLALLTGGLHLDGLADTCDGVFSSRPRERMLEIMRDSRLGTNGGLALIFVLLAKVLLISELSLRGVWLPSVIAAACAAGRGVSVLLMYGQRYARDEGMGNLFIGKVTFRQAAITVGITAVLAIALLGMNGLVAFLFTLVAIYVIAKLLKRTLGGQTGDTLGAAIELGEVVFLLALL